MRQAFIRPLRARLAHFISWKCILAPTFRYEESIVGRASVSGAQKISPDVLHNGSFGDERSSEPEEYGSQIPQQASPVRGGSQASMGGEIFST
jgi:hypothetical protein